MQWQTPQVLPFGNFSLSPAALSIHYGQTIFEGMKAFRMEDGRINIFRPQKHYDRFVLSADRLCMPVVSPEIFKEGLRRLVGIDKIWVPGEAGSALYIRPFMIATESRLRVKVKEYYEQLIRVEVDADFVRAVRGGEESGGTVGIAGTDYILPPVGQESISHLLRTGLENIRYGRVPDPYGWNFIV